MGQGCLPPLSTEATWHCPTKVGLVLITDQLFVIVVLELVAILLRL